MECDTRRLLAVVALALLVAFAGCSGGAGGDAAKQEATASGAPAEQESAATQQDKSADMEFQGQSAQVRKRALIRTGTVALEVEDYDAARNNLTRATRRMGGFVSDSSEEVHTRENRSWTTGKLVLRVPKENFSALVSRAKRSGEVRKASTGSKDVTDKLVDIEARLNNLKAQRDRLRAMYDEANRTENVLKIQERLSEVQSEIERLEAQRKSLRQQVAYSTLTVRLNEPRPDPERPNPDRDEWYDTGLLSAFVSSANGVVVVLRGLAVGIAYAAPYALAFGVPVGGAFAFWRRRQSDDPAQPDLPNVPDSDVQGPDEESEPVEDE